MQKLIKQIEKILKSSKFSFKIEDNFLTCSYNNEKGNFRIKLPYYDQEPVEGIPEQDKKDLALIVKIFSENPNRLSGDFPKHILDQAKGAQITAKKEYTVSEKFIYFNTKNWQKCEGEIDLSCETIKKGRFVETKLLPDSIKVVYHPKIGGTVSVLHKGHLITGGALPEFNSSDLIMNFINSIKKIGPDLVMAKADQLVSQRNQEINNKPKESKDNFQAMYKQSEAIHKLLMQDENIYDSWGAEEVAYVVRDERPAIRFIANGLLHVGPIEIIKEEKTFTIKTFIGTKTKDEKKDILPNNLMKEIDLMIEYPGDQEQYEKLCKGLNEELKERKKAA